MNESDLESARRIQPITEDFSKKELSMTKHHVEELAARVAGATPKTSGNRAMTDRCPAKEVIAKIFLVHVTKQTCIITLR
jgi:hypothetical protein